MSNNIYDGEIYNEEDKLEFLNTITKEKTRDTYKATFLRSCETEKILEKDLYNFTTDELLGVIKASNPISLSSARQTFTVLKKYIKHSMPKRKNNLNPIEPITTQHLRNCIDKTKKILFSDEEINKMLTKEMGGELVNAQDAIVVHLIFNGVWGSGGSEILNLTINDVNFKNKTIIVKDDKFGERTLTFKDNEGTNRLFKLIEKANDDTKYENKNGMATGRVASLPLMDTIQVVKSTVTRQDMNQDRADMHLIYRRLKQLSKWFGWDYLTAKNIQKSGMVKMAKDLYLEHGKLTNDELSIVAEHFGLRKTINNTYETYSFNLIRDYVNADNIEDLYDIIVK